MGEPGQNGVQMTPTNMAVRAVYEALQNNQMMARIFIALFLLYPFVDNIYAKVQDAGLVPSMIQQSVELLQENKTLITEHKEIMEFQGERSLRLQLAECINNVVAGSGNDKDLQAKGIGLCVASLEDAYFGKDKMTLPLEMSRLINGLLREQ